MAAGAERSRTSAAVRRILEPMLDQKPIEFDIVFDVVAQAQAEQPLEREDGGRFLAYTDGSCLRNPGGPSGFGAIVQSLASGRTWELAGHIPASTNNRAEWAALVAAYLLVPDGGDLLAYTDSEYVLNVALGRWKRKVNLDLWTSWDALQRARSLGLELRWVRGHAADPGNERADALATLAAYNFKRAAWAKSREVPPAARELDGLPALARGDWEQRFVRDVLRQVRGGRKLSPKQQAVVDRIAARQASA
jgi:ribonuclease HI